MSTFTPFDYRMMARALELARKGQYTTTPNPNVGCVITLNDEIVGEGFHIQAGGPHAEVHALAQAKDNARGATAYVTLEPCSHYGRTPPCSQALIDAGIKRVVCAMKDPNPLVAGRGFAMLREAGIEVEYGLLTDDAESINPAFLHRMRKGRPWVQLKLAASLDGRTALSNGESQWITSPQARRDVQRLRAKCGAILSTSQTVCIDDASLNVRQDDLAADIRQHYPTSSIRQPLRVILDRQHNLHDGLKLYQSDSPVLRVAEHDADICVGLDSDGNLALNEVLDTLANAHNVNHVWVEAGATLAGALIRAQLVDEIILYLAPKLMGGDARGLLDSLNLTSMDDVPALDILDMTTLGPDIRITATLKSHSQNK